MNENIVRIEAHTLIDHVFCDLLTTHGLTTRPEQVALSHLMLNTMLRGEIALCDAGTGIGKTLAYLTAGTAFLQYRAKMGLEFQPLMISTSSIALQRAIQREYLPQLSAALLEDGIIQNNPRGDPQGKIPLRLRPAAGTPPTAGGGEKRTKLWRDTSAGKHIGFR